MSITEMKCKNCGAKIETNEFSKIAECSYCGSKFVLDKGLNENKNNEDKSSAKIDSLTNILSNVFSEKIVHNAPPRPRFKVGLFIFLFILWIFPAILYAIFTIIQQAQWDKNYIK
jgi:DNA-directed RNA polymerase subunit RPC12/RpoP